VLFRSLGRRAFLAGAASIAAASGVGGFTSSARANTGAQPKRRAKNLIFAVADGCGTGTVQLGEMFVNMRDGRSLNWTKLWERRDATTSIIDTHSANGHVTDSAASASAWAIGELVNNKAICWTPDNRTPRPLFLRAKDAGKAIGMVATTYIWDATTIAWVANAPSRKLWRDLTEQLIEAKPDVAFGGGANAFPEELLAADPALRVVRTREEMLGAAKSKSENERLFGLFTPETFPYQFEYDRAIPTISEMSRIALNRLRDASPDGFTLIVEGSKVDHAAHANDGGSLVNELANFDTALGELIDFTDEDGETLLVVTTDHGNANPALTYYAEQGVASFENILKTKHSFKWILSKLRTQAPNDRSPQLILSLLEEASGLTLSKNNLQTLKRYVLGAPTDAFALNTGIHCVFGSILANHTGLAFLSPNHTSDPVLATAIGPGRELFSPRMRINEIHHCLAGALGLPPAS